MTEETKDTIPTKEAAPKAAKPKGKKQKRSVVAGQMHIKATFNNTIIAFSDKKGNVLTTSSAGGAGFRGSKKGTAYAAQIAAEKSTENAKQQFGMKSVDVFVKGVGLGRDAAIRVLSSYEISINSIQDVTPIPHGGVRMRRMRRG
jgi:small subunit ribosomal protein S11